MKSPLGITDVVLRDAHQSLFATRLRTEDMLPIAHALDEIGYWSLEIWGGATFDACIRYLGEDPWQRLRQLRAAMPKTRMQMLFRGQNILGYRHYADDVVEKFVELSASNGIDVFRIFDAMNDVRNLETAVKATLKVGKHAQGTLSYTVSPVHNLETWVTMARRLEEMGSNSICIKDMAGLLTPYNAFELVSALKQTVKIPIAMQCHATTGMSTAAIVKASEAGLDIADTAISSMSMTTGHSATESIVSILQNTARDTGLQLEPLEKIAAYFRTIRKKYAKFEGSLKGVDSRILLSQVPGGMLSNMENQLREQGAVDKMDAVLHEIPRVRADLGFIPLVTPTSQIVGTQAVLNVLLGPYKNITQETAAVLKGEYGATPAPVNAELQARVLEGASPILCRPADLLQPELGKLTEELETLSLSQNIALSEHEDEDILTYALFPKQAFYFFKNRHNPEAFEPSPSLAPQTPEPATKPQNPTPPPVESPPTNCSCYRLLLNGTAYDIQIFYPDGHNQPAKAHPHGMTLPKKQHGAVYSEPHALPSATPIAKTTPTTPIQATLTGIVLSIHVKPSQTVQENDLLCTMEAMKMVHEIRSPQNGIIHEIHIIAGGTVESGQSLFSLA